MLISFVSSLEWYVVISWQSQLLRLAGYFHIFVHLHYYLSSSVSYNIEYKCTLCVYMYRKI